MLCKLGEGDVEMYPHITCACGVSSGAADWAQGLMHTRHTLPRGHFPGPHHTHFHSPPAFLVAAKAQERLQRVRFNAEDKPLKQGPWAP